MTYTKKQFLEDVAVEATALKEHATPEELARLNLEYFSADSPSHCIYGQMTGDCRSYRASDLIFSCCKRYVDMPKEDTVYFLPTDDFNKMKKYVNGESIPGVSSPTELKAKRSYEIWHFSTIEAYILTPDAKIANLIAFLKGERKDLVL